MKSTEQELVGLQMMNHVLKLVIYMNTEQVGLLIKITSIVRELL